MVSNMKAAIMYEIPDFTGYYAAETGDIFTTLQQGCRDRFDLSKRIEPIKLNPRYCHGYPRVYLRRDSTGLREDVYIHRIVAEMFIPNPNNLPEVNHINSNPSDPEASNLEWVTHKENLEYAFTNGNMTRDKHGKYCHK